MQFNQLKRREFITLLGGAIAWPLAVRAQQSDLVRRIGVLMVFVTDDPEGLARLAAFRQRLRELGWSDGGNLRIDERWGAGDVERYRRHAEELAALAPDVIVAVGGPATTALQRASRTIPIVFVNVVDPVGAGFVASLARPGGNATGFMNFEYGLSGKWLELLKQIAPRVMRAGVLRDPANPFGIGQFAAIQAVSSPFGVELSPIGVRDTSEIERGVKAFAQEPNGGLIVTSGSTAVHRDLIIALAARHRLPAVYPFRYYPIGGGLISYGPNTIKPFQGVADYVDRILKGEKPADLPVQAPTKYELVINLKTARALGLEVPPTLLARADEVVE